MAEPRKPTAEIARLVGIPDQGYFARLFQQLAAMTPREYRSRQGRKKPWVSPVSKR